MRVVRSPDGTTGLDATGKAAGRGAYVCRDGACLDRAVGRGGLARALRVPIPAGLGAELARAAGLTVRETAAAPSHTTDPHNDTTDTNQGGARGKE